MKLVLFQASGQAEVRPGLLTEHGVVDISAAASAARTPQLTMQGIIDQFDSLRPRLEQLALGGALALDRVRLRAPLPAPGKILCSVVNIGQTGDPPPLLMTLKSAESVVGPDDTVVLPDFYEPWDFVPELDLGLVIKGPAKQLGQADWRRAVFGYVCCIDVSARGGDANFGRDNWLAKADTLHPIGPCITTADEIADPAALRARSWQNGQPRQDYSLAEAHYGVPQLVEFATAVMTLHTGDVLSCGSNPAGATAVKDGDVVEVDIDGVGRMRVRVAEAAGTGQAGAAIGAGRQA